MAKTNFTKVENILDEGMRSINTTRLLELADIATGLGKTKQEDIEPLTITLVKIHLKWYFKLDRALYKKLGLDKDEAVELVQPKSQRSPQEVTKIKNVKGKVDKYLKEFEKDLPEDYDEQLIEFEREESINQRFNVRDHWLPLH